MSDVFEHNPDDHEDPAAGPLWLVAGLGIFLFIITVLTLTALSYNQQSLEEESKVTTATAEEIEDLRAEQQTRLAEAHLDQFEDEIALVIPIERAMELIAEEYGERR